MRCQKSSTLSFADAFGVDMMRARMRETSRKSGDIAAKESILVGFRGLTLITGIHPSRRKWSHRRNFEGRWAVAIDIHRVASALQARPPHSPGFAEGWKIPMRVLMAIRRGTPL